MKIAGSSGVVVVAGFILLSAIMVGGCKKSEQEGQTVQTNAVAIEQRDPIDLRELREAFSNVDPSMRVFVDECINSIRARDFSFAVEQLEKLLRNPRLTPQQRQAIQITIARLRTARK